MQAENDRLRRQLDQLSEAKNREVLDIQHHFADRVRELERLKGLDKAAEIDGLNAKISELEKTDLQQKSKNAELALTVSQLEKKLNETEENRVNTAQRLERLKKEAEEKVEVVPSTVNYDELLDPLREHLTSLGEVVALKDEEIKTLEELIQKEGEERARLERILGMPQGEL